MSDELAAAVAAFAARGGHPVRDLLAAGPAPFAEWETYPEGEAADPVTGYSWYYHAHPQSEPLLVGTHGHFHLYCAPRLFDGVAPADAPPEGDPNDRASVCLLVSLAMTARGKPGALFALNRLSAGQWIYPAAETLERIERFAMDGTSPCADVGRWLGAFVRSRLPEIAGLLEDRDRALADSRDAAEPDGGCREVLIARTIAATI